MNTPDSRFWVVVLMVCPWGPSIDNVLADTQLPMEPSPQAGVNIISLGNNYTDPVFRANQVDTFMAGLAESGMQRISIRVTWETMERVQGQYSSSSISNLRRVAESAGRNGLSVMLDFHTLFHEGSYTAPSWVANYPGRNGNPGIHSVIMTARNPQVAQAYLNMQHHVLTQLKDVTSIDVVALMNEPWPFGDEGTQGAQADMAAISQLLIESGKIVKQVNPDWQRAARFTLSYNPWSDRTNKRFDEALTFEALDVIGLNVYLDPSGQIDNMGADGALRDGGSWSAYRRAVDAARENGRELWVTEFGLSSIGMDTVGEPYSLERQRAYYQDISTRWWEGDHRPDAVLAWAIEPNTLSTASMNIWDVQNFNWNPAGLVYSQYALANVPEPTSLAVLTMIAVCNSVLNSRHRRSS